MLRDILWSELLVPTASGLGFLVSRRRNSAANELQDN